MYTSIMKRIHEYQKMYEKKLQFLHLIFSKLKDKIFFHLGLISVSTNEGEVSPME